MTRKALGRGLEALIPRAVGEAAPVISGEKVTIPVDGIRPNPWQPRRSPDPLKMDELVRSIQARGVLEPVLVRPVDGKYELVAGERRLVAFHLHQVVEGLDRLPAARVQAHHRHPEVGRELDLAGALRRAGGPARSLQTGRLCPVGGRLDRAAAVDALAEVLAGRCFFLPLGCRGRGGAQQRVAGRRSITGSTRVP